MKFVATADLHVHRHRVGSADGGSDRLEDGLSALRQTLDVARAERCPWVFCGDLKGPRDVWPQDALNGCRAVFRDYEDVEKLLLPGNHDGLYGKFGTGLAPFAEYATVIEKPWVGAWSGLFVAAWPYGDRRQAEFAAFRDEVKRARIAANVDFPIVLLIHVMLRGCALGPTDAPADGVSHDMLHGDLFDLVVAGDVHKGQVLLAAGGKRPTRSWRSFGDVAARPGRRRPAGGAVRVREPGRWNGEVLVPGSPYQQTWGEAGEWPKGCLVVDAATGAVDLVPVAAPRFRAVDVADQPELARLAADPPDWAGDVVRLAVPAAELALRGSAGMVDVVRAGSRAREVRVVPRRAQVAREAAPVHAGTPTEELLRRWLERAALPEGVTLDTALAAGLALLREPEETAP